MKTFEMSRPLTSKALNETLYKQFNVKINLDKYSRDELENYRNLLRTKVHQVESQANFNDLLTNEDYQKDKFVLNVLNTKIKEMLGEAKLSEKAVSKAQQQAAGAALAAKRAGKKPAKGPSAAMAKMSTKELEKFAGTKHKGLPKHVDEMVDEASGIDNFTADDIKQLERIRDINELKKQAFALISTPSKKPMRPEKIAWFKQALAGMDNRMKIIKMMYDLLLSGEGNAVIGTKGSMGKNSYRTKFGEEQVAEAKKKSKPDFLDMDKDGNKKEPMKKAIKDKKVKEGAKPDFLDMDKDGNKKEPMKKAIKDKKKVKESRLLQDARIIVEAVAHYIAEDEEGKAKSITAAADIVNDFTSWMQRVGNYQTKSMIELADNIRANFGVQQAETFKQSVGQALEGALNALTSAREEINNAVAVLAGEAPAENPMGPEPTDGMDMDMAEPDDMNLPTVGGEGEDEFAASDAAAGGPETTGRMKRESIERGNRLMKILGS